MRALLRSLAAHADDQIVTMLGRTNDGRVKVEFNRGEVRTVDKPRLHAETNRNRRITDEEFDRLPWQGKGVDPLTLSTADLFKSMEKAP